jgi:RNA polymerase sigma factor (sigma-70 family)
MTQEYKGVRAFVKRIVRDYQTAEDITQEAFLRLDIATRKGRFEDDLHVVKFLYVVARHLAYGHARKKKPSLSEAAHHFQADPLESACLTEAIELMPVGIRQIYTLLQGGMNYANVGLAVGMRENAVRMAWTRYLDKVRQASC